MIYELAEIERVFKTAKMCRSEAQIPLTAQDNWYNQRIQRQESTKDDSGYGFLSIFCCIVIVVIVLIFLFIIIDIDGSGGGGGGFFYGGGSRSRGSWGGGGGARGGCFDATVTVWAKNESQPDTKAKQIMIKDLEEGDLVATASLKTSNNKVQELIWTRATDVDISWGKWNAHLFEFTDGRQIKVTSPHLMILWRGGVSYFVRADAVHAGDVMKVGEDLMEVTKVEDYVIKSKVAVETEDGTIQANQVLASGICDDNPQVIGRMVEAKKMLSEYKLEHFGEDYSHKCMDTVAWKDAYLSINGFPVQD